MDSCHIWVDTTDLFNKHAVFVSNPRNRLTCLTRLTKYHFTNIAFKTLGV